MKLILTTIALMTLSVSAIADINQKPTESHPIQFIAQQTAEAMKSDNATVSILNKEIKKQADIVDETEDNNTSNIKNIDTLVINSINIAAIDIKQKKEIIDNESDDIAVKIQEVKNQTDIDVDIKINEVESLVSQLNTKDDELSNLIQEITTKQIKEKKQATTLAEQKAKKQKVVAVVKRKTKVTSSKSLGRSSRPMIAARKASRNAHSRSKGLCARYVRLALQSGGYRFTPNASAYQYETRGTLRKAGFSKISNNSRAQVGDVVVVSRSRAHPHGHMAIFDGRNWVSDFRQRNKSPYRKHYRYTTWRDSSHLNGASAKGLYMATR